MLLEGVAGRFYLVRVSNEAGAEGRSYHTFLEIVCVEGRITKSLQGVWAFQIVIKEESNGDEGPMREVGRYWKEIS